jgi:hypothetical protein
MIIFQPLLWCLIRLSFQYTSFVCPYACCFVSAYVGVFCVVCEYVGGFVVGVFFVFFGRGVMAEGVLSGFCVKFN